MLEEKLRQASRSNAKQRTRLLVILGFAAIITVASIVLMTRFSNTPSNSPAASPIVTPSSAPEALPNEAANKQRRKQLREQFKLSLGLYEKEIAPALIDANLSAWNAQQEGILKDLKDSAIAAFAVSDYNIAIQQLSKLENSATQILKQHAELFINEFSMAKAALQADNHSQAKLHIGKALQLKPNDPDAQQLAKQIDALPKIIALLNTAAVARTENNLEKEYAAITSALKLAPQRQHLNQRQLILAKHIKENKFTPLIARALEYVAKRQLRAAQNNYRLAKALDPSRPELRVLKQAINKLATSQDLNNAIAHGKTAIQQDNWRKARTIYAAASQRHPNNKNIHDALQLSNKLLSLHDQMDAYLQRPERLSSQNIAAAAQKTLFETRPLLSNSPSLKQKTITLKALIAATNVNIQVTIRSDNKTFILLRGIGKVGLTLTHTIQLKPGMYSFEGIRKGYKSKLLNVRIPIDVKSFAVEVICDEPI